MSKSVSTLIAILSLTACGDPCLPSIKGGVIIAAEECPDDDTGESSSDGSSDEGESHGETDSPPCNSDEDCMDGDVCDLHTNTCEDEDDMDPVLVCEDEVVQVGDAWGPCDKNGACLDTGNWCFSFAVGNVCIPVCAGDCPDFQCSGGTCTNAQKCIPVCDDDADCPMGMACVIQAMPLPSMCVHPW